MKALVISEYAHPSKIPLTRDAPVPVPTLGSDELLINVHSAGLNFFDVSPTPAPLSFCFYDVSSHMKILQAQGKYETQPSRPLVLGFPAPSRSRHLGIPKKLATGCLDIPKARMESRLLPSRSTYCRSQMPSRLTRAQVRLVVLPSIMHALIKRVV